MKKFLLTGIILAILAASGVSCAQAQGTGTSTEAALTQTANRGTEASDKLAFVQGNLIVSGNIITVTPSTTPPIALAAPSETEVGILYDNNTGVIQGLMLNWSGEFPPVPEKPFCGNMTTVQGTLTVSDSIITITPGTTPSIALVAPSETEVGILYDNSTGVIQGLMLNWSGEFPPMKEKPFCGNMTTVQGTLTVSDSIITITPGTTPSIALVAPSETEVGILYDNSTGVIQGLMLNRSDRLSPTPENLPGNGDNRCMHGDQRGELGCGGQPGVAPAPTTISSVQGESPNVFGSKR
jgi:citrate lyase gamma subunit